MKIIHIIPNLNKGGAERLCIDIALEQQKRGHKAYVLTFKAENEYIAASSELTIITVKATYHPSIISKSSLNIEELQRVINDINPAIIHSHLYQAELIAYHLKTTAAFYTHIHSKRKELIKQSVLSNKQSIIRFFERKKYLSLIRKKNVRFIAISNDCFQFVTKDLRCKEANVQFLPNAIKFETFKKAPVHTNDFSTTKIQLINIGRFLKFKNQTFLVDVLKHLNDKSLFDFYLTFLGDGPELESVRSRASELGLEKKVSFKGIVNNPEFYLKSSDLYIHSSLSEAFGLVFIEAMAAGIPVISTNGGGNKDIIINDKNGYLLNSHDVTQFSDKVLTVFSKPALYNDLSRFSFNFAKKYDISEYCVNLLKFYANKNQ